LKARDREEAYTRAVELGSDNHSTFESPDGKKTGRWVFEGLTSLLPIYEELEDGSEIMWTQHENRTVRKIRSLVKSKQELEAFDDENET